MTRPCILIQALSGRGKTTFAATGGKPFIIAVESKARPIIPVLNPDAFVFPVDSRADLEKAIKAVKSPKLLEQGYTRIVLDSYSDLTESIPEWYGMPYPLQIQDYGVIGHHAMEMVKALLKAPLPSVVIARSEAKEQGKLTRVVPGSLGKSAASLPAKCVLTAETRHDEELGWLVDTTPDDYTQRSGLPWVPCLFHGQVDEFLALVERTPKPEPTFADTLQAMADLKATSTPEVSAAAHAFVESIDPTPSAELDQLADATVTLLALVRQKGVNLDALGAYLMAKGRMSALPSGAPDWTSQSLKTVKDLTAILSDDTRRHSFITVGLAPYTTAA